jgi:hypothetical protein
MHDPIAQQLQSDMKNTTACGMVKLIRGRAHKEPAYGTKASLIISLAKAFAKQQIRWRHSGLPHNCT